MIQKGHRNNSKFQKFRDRFKKKHLENLILDCDFCEKQTSHVYLGKTNHSNNQKQEYHYQCLVCNFQYTLPSIIKHEKYSA